MSGKIPPRPPRAPPPTGRASRGRAPVAGPQADKQIEGEADPDHFTAGPDIVRGRSGSGSGTELIERHLPPGFLRHHPLSAADLEQLVRQFSATVASHPGASRQALARLLARTLLRRRGLSSLLGSLSGAEMEELCAHVGDALEGSPLLGEALGGAGEPPEEFSP